jgi:predicted permease
MLSDLRSAWRLHRGQPAFTLFAILILAIGIGAGTTVFSVANVVLLKSLPYPDSDRLMALFESRPRERQDAGFVSIADFLDWRAESASFADMGAHESTTYGISGRGDAEQVDGAVVTARWFETLGVRPQLGATFDASDESPGAPRRIILTHGLWQRRFGGDPAILGQTVALNGWPHSIVGVMPASFVPPVRTWELFGAMRFDPAARDSVNARASHNLNVVARLKPGVSPAQAIQEMDVLSKRLESSYPVNRGHYARVATLIEAQRGKLRPAMRILLAAVGLVLLIACFNVSNLLLARATARAREISIRIAIGADRGRIARLLLTESLTLSLAAAGAGLLGAVWTIAYLRTVVPPELGLAPDDIRLDMPVLLFALGLAVLSGVLFGFAPALGAARSSVNDALRSGGWNQTPSRWSQRQRAAIVAGEMALSVLLLIGAGLLVRSFLKLVAVDPGFRAEKVLTMQVSLPASKYMKDEQKLAFQKQLLDNVGHVPGVVRAGITSFLPVSGQDSRMGLVIDGIAPDPKEPRRANWRRITPGYMEAMQIPLRRGRFFADSDTREAPMAMLVNETAAKKYWQGRDPVGTRARLATMESWATVVGVVADVKHWGLDEPARPEAYLSLWQAPFWLNNLVVRTQGDPTELALEVRRQLRALDPDLPPAAIRTMQEVIDHSTALRRFYMMLLTALAAIAVILAAAGIYAQLAYAVSQRARELGLRMALGAQRGDMVRLVVKQGLAMSLAGAAVGVAAAWGLSRLLQQLLFGVKPLDPIAMIGAPLILLAVALLASLIPSWKASKADPAAALRL